MPRMFMAVRREQRHPITEILARTPEIPAGCQWGIFLRNHDELTLEMVTDDERDYMYAEYAKDPRMKRNIGIGRRLAPLVDNDRRVAELLHALLFSFPGSPVLYYGDEIGMGDNIYLGDRDGVRTPMQWSPDRNAGFSRADFAQLYLPPLMDPVYGYQACNVEAELRDPSSLLHWMKRMLEVRRQHPVFGTGTMEVISAENPSVLAYVRVRAADATARTSRATWSSACATCRRFAQPAELPLQRYEGKVPIELLGRVPFPRIGELPYFVTLAPVRLLLVPDGGARERRRRMIFPTALADLIPAYLARQRWYAGSDRPDGTVRLAGRRRAGRAGGAATACSWSLSRPSGARYQLLIGERPAGEPAEFLNGHEPAVLGD